MSLTISEKFLLLAQHPEKGRFIIDGFQIQYGIIGALLLEMSIEGLIDIQDENLVLKPSKVKSNTLVAKIELEIRKSTKPRKVKYWVTKLSRKSKSYKKSLLKSLEKERLIRVEHKKFLGIIPYQMTYLLNQRFRRDLIRELKREILSGEKLSSDQIVMFGLIEACKMHKILSTDKEELKIIKKKLKEILANSPIAGSVNKTIQQVQAAIFVTVIASAAAASGSSH